MSKAKGGAISETKAQDNSNTIVSKVSMGDYFAEKMKNKKHKYAEENSNNSLFKSERKRKIIEKEEESDEETEKVRFAH